MAHLMHCIKTTNKHFPQKTNKNKQTRVVCCFAWRRPFQLVDFDTNVVYHTLKNNHKSVCLRADVSWKTTHSWKNLFVRQEKNPQRGIKPVLIYMSLGWMSFVVRVKMQGTWGRPWPRTLLTHWFFLFWLCGQQHEVWVCFFLWWTVPSQSLGRLIGHKARTKKQPTSNRLHTLMSCAHKHTRFNPIDGFLNPSVKTTIASFHCCRVDHEVATPKI